MPGTGGKQLVVCLEREHPSKLVIVLVRGWGAGTGHMVCGTEYEGCRELSSVRGTPGMREDGRGDRQG